MLAFSQGGCGVGSFAFSGDNVALQVLDPFLQRVDLCPFGLQVGFGGCQAIGGVCQAFFGVAQAFGLVGGLGSLDIESPFGGVQGSQGEDSAGGDGDVGIRL